MQNTAADAVQVAGDVEARADGVYLLGERLQSCDVAGIRLAIRHLRDYGSDRDPLRLRQRYWRGRRSVSLLGTVYTYDDAHKLAGALGRAHIEHRRLARGGRPQEALCVS